MLRKAGHERGVEDARIAELAVAADGQLGFGDTSPAGGDSILSVSLDDLPSSTRAPENGA